MSAFKSGNWKYNQCALKLLRSKVHVTELIDSHMRHAIKIFVIAIFTVSSVMAEDITTLKGETFKKVTVTRVEPDGIAVMHAVGVAKIPFSDLPKEWQEKYGYQARKDTPAPINGPQWLQALSGIDEAEIQRRIEAHAKAGAASGEAFRREGLLNAKAHHMVKAAGLPWNSRTYEAAYEAAKAEDASAHATADSRVIRFAPLGVSQAVTEAAYGSAVGSEPGATETEHGREYHVGDFVIWVAFVNGASAWQHFQKTDKSEITKAEMERILEANGPFSEWMGPLKLTNGGLGYASKSRQLIFAYRSESHDALLETMKQFAVDSSGSGRQEAPSPPSAGVPATAREAADAYIESLKQEGIVFASEFRTMMAYPHLFPPTAEVIYTLDYRTQAGVRLVAPYTITVKQSGDSWEAVGGTPGDRTADLNTDPVIDNAGFWHRSPMEQFMGDAMGRGMKRRP